MPKAAVAKVKLDPAQAWPAAKVKLSPLAKIVPYPENPRTHPAHQIKMLARMMVEHGVDQPIVVDENGVILKGHGRLLAAIEAGFDVFPVVQHIGLTDAQKRAMRIEDNQSALLSGWDAALIKADLAKLETAGYDLALLGFTEAQLSEYKAFGGEDVEDRGKLLELINVTIGEPKHQVSTGSHYVLSGRHHLFCVSVVEEWATYSTALKGGALFAPYPGVFVPFSVRAKNRSIVMVQPDPYVAGHILDRYAEVHGEKAIKEAKA